MKSFLKSVGIATIGAILLDAFCRQKGLILPPGMIPAGMGIGTALLAWRAASAKASNKYRSARRSSIGAAGSATSAILLAYAQGSLGV
jgi:hypothetical protein